MFCRNCGEELTGSPRFCVYCGAKPMTGSSFCPGCGAPTTLVTEICLECGARIIVKGLVRGISPKSRLTTTLLAFFLGVFGAHRFYVGKTVSASLMLFLGIFGLVTVLANISPFNTEWFFVGVSFIIVVEIWAFIDFIFVVMARMKDNEGRLIQKRWLAVPAREQQYYYIKYTTTALRVIAWVVLVLGLIGSLVWGVSTGGIEGGVWIIIGLIGSFLAWLLLLTARELLKLFMDVKGNTRNTSERIAKESG